ncbi:MAG: glycosyl hydrolase [Steroidobacteraceae bacterium]
MTNSADGSAGRLDRAAGTARVAARLLVLLFAAAGAASAADDRTESLGLGRYYLAPRGSESPPAATYVTGDAANRPAPTNQWYSSVIFQQWSQPIHAHPMTYRATEAGFEVGLPIAKLSVENGGRKREVSYPHVAALVVAPVGFQPRDARLAGYSDWLAKISMASGVDALTATVLHGSPFSYYECSCSDVRIRLHSAPTVVADPRASGHDPRVAAFVVDGRPYAIFGPTGATWSWDQPGEIVLHLPGGSRYFSVAGLPDTGASTLGEFLQVAYAFPTDTRADWSYDERAGVVRTTFRVQTVAREGQNLTTLMGLYPHQWSAASPAPSAPYQYTSVRGPIRVARTNEFTTERRYRGFVPWWPGLADEADASNVQSLLVGDLAKADQLFTKMGNGTYWWGKGLGATAQLLNIAEVEGQTAARDKLLAKLQERMESWFDGEHSHYFVRDTKLGTFIGFPQEYESVRGMNDHHFHYGYWITGAAQVAFRNPAWARPDQWGGMVGMLIADIANDDRTSRDFPYLRNFDVYEGHSWASGTADFDAGNNQESSSEAVNAWAGLVLWGEASGNRKLRDLGAYLYTTEVASVQQYWFDLDGQVLAQDYGKPFAAMVFGGKYAYNTWWTQEPRQILGINLLPFTPASTYLAADPKFIRKTVDALPADVKVYESNGATDGTPADVWQDVLASYIALADPQAGLAAWSRRGSVEFGETRTHTLFWLLSLKEMGVPELSIGADAPLHAVFRDSSGKLTYLAYNAGDAPRRVTFTDGHTLDVPPRSLASAR